MAPTRGGRCARAIMRGHLTIRQAAEEISRVLAAMKAMLYGEGGARLPLSPHANAMQMPSRRLNSSPSSRKRSTPTISCFCSSTTSGGLSSRPART